ncbi:hypothetical protein EVAR_45588_1 [Eumeta japonica]|uniref:Uncharacterized protein n=1 Tax=Eumeta variegata TaxID=151549 RepID=A0A4C1YXI7_EUMVA|nr:hypothetical protein EVAR_45588_1 [Eumeta japonica]
MNNKLGLCDSVARQRWASAEVFTERTPRARRIPSAPGRPPIGALRYRHIYEIEIRPRLRPTNNGFLHLAYRPLKLFTMIPIAISCSILIPSQFSTPICFTLDSEHGLAFDSEPSFDLRRVSQCPDAVYQDTVVYVTEDGPRT